MSTKLQNRLVIHPNNDSWKSLHSFIPPEILPEEYGGAVKQSDLINLVENADSLDEQFREQFKYGYAKTKHIRMLKEIITSENETPDSEKKSSAKT
ncbi:clavesin-2 [Nephila pilipes]|uniref:Clavesin-2 n=1 Tax=Nephila pilipes TaxID=299642 RepID=A0A8X6MRL4_NEPPI|nr:clavesin-2 [Nephila pilipes]